MTDITLRPYQRDFIDAVRREFVSLKRDGNKPAVVGVAPCGAGKTIMTGWMIKESLARGKRSIFFVHRQELIRQTSETFERLEIPHGIIDAKAPMQLDLPVQIASVQTLARRLGKVPAPDFLICDECHHILAKTYKKIINAYPEAFLLGVTATPQRTGGITLADAFNALVESLSVNELIKLGNLTPFRYFAPEKNFDLSKVRTKFGEYNQGDLDSLMRTPSIVGDIVSDYQRLAAGKSAICYCVNIQHSMEVAEAFQRAGIPAAHCDGETPTGEREAIVENFRRGELKILCNAELFGEGFDVPNMQAVILARPTKSLTLYIQQALRPLRPDPDDPNKVAVIIDHVQNYLRHGLPNSIHKWTLNPNENKCRCPSCKKFVTPNVIDNKKFCPICGAEFAKVLGSGYRPRHRKTEHGDLIEISVAFDDQTQTEEPAKIPETATPKDSEFMPEPTVTKKPTTPEEFLEIAKERNYKIGWVAIKAMEFAKTEADFKHIGRVCGYKPGWAYHHWQEYREKHPTARRERTRENFSAHKKNFREFGGSVFGRRSSSESRLARL